MQTARRQTMEAYYEGRKGSLTEKTIKMLNKVQQPQLGSLRRDVRIRCLFDASATSTLQCSADCW